MDFGRKRTMAGRPATRGLSIRSSRLYGVLVFAFFGTAAKTAAAADGSGGILSGVSYVASDFNQLTTPPTGDPDSQYILCLDLVDPFGTNTRPTESTPAASNPDRASDSEATRNVSFLTWSGAYESFGELFQQLMGISFPKPQATSPSPTPDGLQWLVLVRHQSSAPNENCAGPETTLQDGMALVVRIFNRTTVQPVRVDLINLDISSKDVTPLNPAPVRVSSDKSNVSEQQPPRIPDLYLTWPARLRGGTLPTLTVRAIISEGDKATLLTLYSDALPQVHMRYHFALSTGIVWNTVRSPSFGVAAGVPVETGSSFVFDLVLCLTVYFVPVDAERPYTWKRLRDINPGFILGMSFTNPTGNFYAGFSFEVARNVEVLTGASLIKVPALAPPGTLPPSPAVPATVSEFKWGFFIGLGFNIGGFVRTVVGK